jgi:uncharacterized protein YaaQ
VARSKLIVAIVHRDDARAVVEVLLAHNYSATRIDSAGGFLRKTNATLLIGVAGDAVSDVVHLIRANTRSRTETADEPGRRRVEVHPAVLFVLDVEAFLRL